ncbi:TFIIS helical bundle-like domain-containing protein [Ditylenchus destructor]|uniref:TFIIS helical bundle-like domain-containing protein n=1 Tax=Ditylenchus destructor TaxID=166010 RepID=A0AAD4NC41_9BILA|nr:TFIIS helical bundle-like domain-containing protein [Ditylenchus destructor]
MAVREAMKNPIANRFQVNFAASRRNSLKIIFQTQIDMEKASFEDASSGASELREKESIDDEDGSQSLASGHEDLIDVACNLAKNTNGVDEISSDEDGGESVLQLNNRNKNDQSNDDNRDYDLSVVIGDNEIHTEQRDNQNAKSEKPEHSKSDKSNDGESLVSEIKSEKSGSHNAKEEVNSTSEDEQNNEEENKENDEDLIPQRDDLDKFGNKWDFDKMYKARVGSRKGRRNADFLINDSDEIVSRMVRSMLEAAEDDRKLYQNGHPAIKKIKLLGKVRSMLLDTKMFESILDGDMMTAVAEWLYPLSENSLPALDIRTAFLKILSNYPPLEPDLLKRSGLGKAVMHLTKHPNETEENRRVAAGLIQKWARVIYNLESTMSSRQERVQFDHQRAVKQQKLRQASGCRSESKRPDSDVSDVNDVSDVSDGEDFMEQRNQRKNRSNNGRKDMANIRKEKDRSPKIDRARVPKLRIKDYVIRPKSKIEDTDELKGKDSNRKGAQKRVSKMFFINSEYKRRLL